MQLSDHGRLDAASRSTQRLERVGDFRRLPEAVSVKESLEDSGASAEQVVGGTDADRHFGSLAPGAAIESRGRIRVGRTASLLQPRSWTGEEEAQLQEYEQKLYLSANQCRRALTAQTAAQSGVIEAEEALEAAQRVVAALEIQERRLEAEAVGMAGTKSQRCRDNWEAKLKSLADKKQAATSVVREARERLESERRAVDLAKQQLRTEKQVASIAIGAVTRQRGRAKAAAEHAAETLPLNMQLKSAGAPPPKSAGSGVAFGSRARSNSSGRGGGGAARIGPQPPRGSRSESRRRCSPASARRISGNSRSASPSERRKESSANTLNALEAAEILQTKLAQIEPVSISPALQRRCEALAADLLAAARRNEELPVHN